MKENQSIHSCEDRESRFEIEIRMKSGIWLKLFIYPLFISEFYKLIISTRTAVVVSIRTIFEFIV